MFRYFLLSTIVFAGILFRFAEEVNQAPYVEPVGFVEFNTGRHIAMQREAGDYPFSALSVKEADGRISVFTYDGDRLSVSDGDLVQIPVHAHGYFRYKQAGEQVYFHGLDGEILWQRELHSYPAGHPLGRMLLMITGDGNRVDILDDNGNYATIPSVSGNILNHYSFSELDESACVVFSNAVRWIARGGDYVADYEPEYENKTLYMKSCAASRNGKFFALHYLLGKEDHIAYFNVTYDEDEDTYSLSKEFDISPGETYPHILQMAVNSYGLIIAAPDTTLFYDMDGDLIREEKIETSSIYRPVYAGSNFFVYGKGEQGIVLDQDGGFVTTLSVASTGEPSKNWRIFSGLKDGIFAIENGQVAGFYLYSGAIDDPSESSASSW